MKKMKKVAVAMIGLIVAIYGFNIELYAAEQVWNIENVFDTSECGQGGTVILSVNLKGDSIPSDQEIVSMSGTLEYDSSLFTVEKADLLPVEDEKLQSCSFDVSSGYFDLRYASNINVKNDGLLLQIQLHIRPEASTGKTTVCITQMKWSGSASQSPVEIEHHVPARITIAKAETPAAVLGDVNQDGKINLTDAKMVMRHCNGAKKLNNKQRKNADVNGDGKVSLADAKLIMKYYNGDISEF